jgi:type IV fimbrial biogenesis protein FimT
MIFFQFLSHKILLQKAKKFMSGSRVTAWIKPSKGFTLLELLTTIALMAVLSTIAIPNIVGVLPKYRLGGSAREILSILHYAKMAAIKENLNVIVEFKPASEECVVSVDDTPENGSWDPGERILKRYTMPPGVNLLAPSFDIAGNVVSFNNRGFADRTGNITVQNSMGDRRVRILPSGHCKIS